MSKKVDVTISCINCGHEFSMSLYRTIWGESPENRELVMSDTINVAICLKCGSRYKLPFSLFYTNSKQHFAVWWEPKRDEAIDEDAAGYAQFVGKDNYLATAPRIADWEEFKETIRKYERGELKGGAPVGANQNLGKEMDGFIKYLQRQHKKSDNSVGNILKNLFFGSKKQIPIPKDLKQEKRLLVLKKNFEMASNFRNIVDDAFSCNSQLVAFEMYTFLFCLMDYILNTNKVEQEIRSELLGLSFTGLQTANGWSSLNLDKKEIHDYTLDRMLKYAKIFNELKVFTTECIKKLIFYQSQLFLEIIEKRKLSMFNPNAEDLWDYDPINMDLFKTHKINVALQEFYIETILPESKIMQTKYTKEYFSI
jgi:hypothetical protein